ncbi:rho GTPase-activating protein SYDE2 isoform X1 [Synchiropus splendidus]|uniref:rho GTPase-activating protein SYDE2 isoform X1 n=1 Tax=Synchiropus splendidus TaxID=270530 RepID=UPI00237DB7C5|nr:rho GTPase-activating protein SYDE2 isoform X1 [Synchiropus splendidus]XP_053718466.1 rho GTPase-activating protein SYDE2 isoform X1 [Synchiropus splendidus]
MADPLRRTLLAKLRGKKSKKGATHVGGYGPAAEGREGKEKVLQPAETLLIAELVDCTAGRMSTYENCVEAGGVVLVRGSGQQERAGGGGGLRVSEQLLGVALQREVPFAGHQGAVCADTVALPHVRRQHFLQCSFGDSIGFGDNPPLSGASRPPESLVTISDADVTIRGPARRCWTFDTQTLEMPGSAPPVTVEETSLIRNIESYGPDGDVGGLQSPTFFPTELEIRDVNMTPLGPSAHTVPYPLDSEDDDYYDNEILPFYERIKEDSERTEVQQDDGSRETDRLRIQLKEAYYLLINAMNDINLDVQQQISGALTQQQGSSSCSSRSRDSLCSRSSAKNMESDSWSSGGEHSPQQVSDTDSLLLCLSEALVFGKLNSKSMVELSADKTGPLLHRCASDGAIRYPNGPLVRGSSLKPTGESEAGLNTVEQSDPMVGLSNNTSSEERLHSADAEESGPLNESSGSINSLSGSSDGSAEAPAQHSDSNKQELNNIRAVAVHGVTVNKMQEWMHKGRLLSSEMKQRIEGSSTLRGGSLNPDRAKPTQGVKALKVKSPRQMQQPAFIENFQTREGGRPSEVPTWRPHLNTITVSKKRNWLQQSSLGRNQCTKEEQQCTVGAEEEGSQCPPLSPSPSPEHLRPSGGGSSRSTRLHLPQVNIGQTKVSPHPRNMDPAEENDADDEGEIWYNPIPEDDEPDSHLRSSVRLLLPTQVDPQRRPSKGADAGHCSRTVENGSEETPGEGLNVVSENGHQGSAAHPTDTLTVHRRMLACKAEDEFGPSTNRSTDVPDLPNTVGFSPPSSPNPAKKSSSINWSFPDKIKSPRTVRKISMKMKKLPELSRKLSVKGTQSSNGSSQPEPRANPPRSNGTDPVPQTSGPQRIPSSGGGQASRNVISRYHLDSSVSTQHSFSKKKNNGSSKSACKGGYLSDGDSPELVAKSGKHGSSEMKRAKETDSSKPSGTDLDIDAFRHYSFGEQPKCSQYISGLMSLHFYGAEDLKPPRMDSRDVYCAIQVDSVNKARTALLTCRTAFLDMDHTFNIELENAQHLKLVVFSWEPTPRRNRVCCHGTVVLPALFRVTRSHQLAVKLEPRGLIYVKLSLMEQWQNSLDGGPDGDREPQVFGVEAWRVVEREESGLMVPLLISKCITEIEKRGCQVVGLYRLCGSAAVKKELREAFERDSHGVELSESTYPDVNVITGVLKDYLRELPYPLITKQLYQAVLDSMASRPLRMGAAGCENDPADSEHTVSLLDHLPEVERVTLRMLLDHLKLVASHQDVNKMTCQNLAVCFGPVLLSQRQEASCHSNRVFIDSEELASALHFKKHIEVLHYLLQLWPVVDPRSGTSVAPSLLSTSDLVSAPPLRRRKERPQVLNLTDAEMAGVLRPKPGRLDSPSNRYAGDWSGCGENYFPCDALLPPPRSGEADYDDVPSEDVGEDAAVEGQEQEEPEQEEIQDEEPQEEEKLDESDSSGDRPMMEEEEEEEEEDPVCNHILPPSLPREHTYQAYVKIQDISPVLSNRVNLRDLQESIDTLIGNLERELNKNKLNVGY